MSFRDPKGDDDFESIAFWVSFRDPMGDFDFVRYWVWGELSRPDGNLTSNVLGLGEL